MVSFVFLLLSCRTPTNAQSDRETMGLNQEEISGQVLSDEQPVVGAEVWLVQSEYRLGVLHRVRLGPQVTDEHGNFSFDSGLEAGREYCIFAERYLPSTVAADQALPLGKRGPIEANTYFGDAPSLKTAVPITLGFHERRRNVNIRMRTAIPYCVSGRVELYGMPFALYLTIQEAGLARTDGSIHGESSEQDGSFRFCGVTPGEYALFTPENGNGIALFSVKEADIGGVVLNIDTTPPKLELRLIHDADNPPRPQMRGGGPQDDPSSSTLRNGQMSVRLLREDGESFVKTAPVPFVGIFDPLSAGNYAVDVIPAAGEYVKSLTFSGVRLAAWIVHLSPGSTETLQISLSRGAGVIKRRVTGEDGGLVSDTVVALIPEGMYNLAQLSIRARQMRTDSHGDLEFGALSPGDYRVVALPRLFRPIREDLEKLLLITSIGQKVRVSEAATIYVTLRPASLE
ncbi:MAG: hypothetical protein U0Q18_25680 [Bryobacteraceae bacterium]